VTLAGSTASASTSQVKNISSWPRSWANFSLFWLYSHRNAWANLHLLGQPNTFLAADTDASTAPELQGRFDLVSVLNVFDRCARPNTLLASVAGLGLNPIVTLGKKWLLNTIGNLGSSV
jgi:hypothetical protein